MSFSSTFTLAFALTATPVIALAHHGWSAYHDKPQKISGVIREVQFANPHATISLQAQNASWLVVLAPPSRMAARGLSPESLQIGATATVDGYAHRSNGNELRAESISLGDRTTQLR